MLSNSRKVQMSNYSNCSSYVNRGNWVELVSGTTLMNKALLAKQFWRIVLQPPSILSKIGPNTVKFLPF